MPQEHDGEALIVDWTLLPGEETLVSSKRGPARLGFARLVKKLKRLTARELGERTLPLVIAWRRLGDLLNGL